FLLFFFSFFSAPATPAIYPLSYTTLFRSRARFAPGRRGRPVDGSQIACWPVATRRASWRPWSPACRAMWRGAVRHVRPVPLAARSEEHTSELQSRRELVCRLLLEKKKYIRFEARQKLHDARTLFDDRLSKAKRIPNHRPPGLSYHQSEPLHENTRLKRPALSYYDL